MTQLPSQPVYPQYGIPPMPVPAKWSGSAIAGFVLSFFGCSIIAALLGLILGIIGILDCRGGRRRGMGLAIAALPISLLSAGMSVVVGVVSFAAVKELVELEKKVVPVIQSGDPLEAANTIRQFTTADFNDDVSKEELAEWLKQVDQKLGRLGKLTMNQQQPIMPSNDEFLRLNFEGTFINGRAPVTIVISMFPLRIVDIEVDANSPRTAKNESK